ncbi:hypothetical protein FVEN_g3816 [Fusarium venenatum]|nr:hypothetical protein FVEN_g3816 [Fusarium venenatum]
MTDPAEQLEKFEREVSPAPTSPPTTLEMRLFPRDYSLPSDYCGWNVELKSDVSTCEEIGASCINYGSIRGCCKGAVKDCASSTFFSVCIPLSSIDKGNATQCGKAGTVCWFVPVSYTGWPECATIYMSSRANRDTTYTAVNCFVKDSQESYFLQDYQPVSTTIETESISTDTDTSTTTTTIPPTSPTSHSTPVGAIVGGVVGGLAIIALLILGIFFYRRKKPTPNVPPVEQIISPTTQPPYSPSFASPPVYNAQTSNPAWLSTSPSPSSPTYNPAGVHYQNMPSTSPQPEQFTNAHINYEPKEVPATNPVGTGNNRAELN